ncbi:MAG: ABC transporter ATP-binding protein [Rugosibacter sp.]|jgi:iron complex transport system ATP-binding protein|nr:iron complex transport system ATP-binding protein [Rugosibacter sp.]
MHSTRLSTHALDVSIGKIRICDALNLSVASGERWAILGRNGVGKSTLLMTLAGLRRPQHGELNLCGVQTGVSPSAPALCVPSGTFSSHDLRRLAKIRGVLPQHQSDPFPATVLETALVGRHPHLGRWDWESEADRAIARQALAAVGLEDFAGREVHTLSGGERQRLAVAQLLTQQPQLFLLDEPLTHLDLAHQVAVMDLFKAITADEATATACIAILHDPGFAVRYCEHALLLFGNGEWLAGRSQEIITADNLSRLYGYPLREIRSDNDRWFIPR